MKTDSGSNLAFSPVIGPFVKTTALVLSLAAMPSVFADQAYEEGCAAALARDYATAFERWGPLAEGNDGRAQFQLALMYHAGLYVDQDESRAVLLYHMAADNGVVEARQFLIAGYTSGWFGLPRNQLVAALLAADVTHLPRILASCDGVHH